MRTPSAHHRHTFARGPAGEADAAPGHADPIPAPLTWQSQLCYVQAMIDHVQMLLPGSPAPDLPVAPGDRETVLTDGDLDTLRQLIRAGTGDHSLRALRSDLAYLEAWSLACDGNHLPWPPDRDLVLRFIAHHLWDVDLKAGNPDHGMPAHVAGMLLRGGFLRRFAPHAPATVRRRLASWRSLATARGGAEVFADPMLRRTLATVIRAGHHIRQPKSGKPVDGALMRELLDHLDACCNQTPFRTRELDRPRLAALRDRALLALAFAAGGRRRSEVAGLAMGALTGRETVEIDDPDWPDGLPTLALRLGRTKTTDAEEGRAVWLAGRPVRHLDAWLEAARIENGPVFRRIDRWGRIQRDPISPQSVNLILKRRLAEIGEDPARYSAHGLRSGYITEAFRAGVPTPEIMEQTLHRSLRSLLGYVQGQVRRESRAARMLG